jgi:uncharacterized cupredoxin-like copper-binding protein
MALRTAAVALAGTVAVFAAGCGTPAPAAVTVTTQAFRYQPDAFEWQAGQPVKLTLRNADTIEHDFVVDRIRFSVAAGSAAHGSHPTSHAGTAAPTPSPDSLHLHAAALSESSLTFTPLAAGTYTVYCSLPGHKEAGMTAQLVVK